MESLSAAGGQAVRLKMKCLIRQRMGTRRAWAGPAPPLTCPSRGEAHKQGHGGRKGLGEPGRRWRGVGRGKVSGGLHEGRRRVGIKGGRGHFKDSAGPFKAERGTHWSERSLWCRWCEHEKVLTRADARDDKLSYSFKSPRRDGVLFAGAEDESVPLARG